MVMVPLVRRGSPYILLVLLWLPSRAWQKCNVTYLDEVSFKQCGNKGYAMLCNNTQQQTFPQNYPPPKGEFKPPLCLLDLSENNFTAIGNESFVHAENLKPSDVMWLYLNYCNLTFIASGAFVNFSSLVYLNLTGNMLYGPQSFESGVFSPLISLTNINLKENHFTTFVRLGQELQYAVNLKGLFVDMCEDCTFGPEFQNLTNLVNISLSGRQNNSCTATRIKNETFKYVRHVQRIWIASCHIESIEAGAFQEMDYLKVLDVSYNEKLTFTGMNNLLYGLRNSTTLKELNANRIHTLWETGIELKFEHIEHLKTLSTLEILHMDLNKIEVLDEKILKPYQLPQSLKEFTLSGNRLVYGKYAQYLYRATNITKLDISRQHLSFDPYVHEHFENPETKNRQKRQLDFTTGTKLLAADECTPEECEISGVLCAPPDLETLLWRKSFLEFEIMQPIAVCNAKRLRRIDLSFNLITKWKKTIFGLDNIIDLDLSENYCDEVEPEFFKRFGSLEKLNLAGNFLGNSLSPEKNSNATELFITMPNLSVFNLSYNHIKRLPKDIFEKQTQLKYLDLKGNSLDQWNTTLNTSQCLTTLDLSGNKLASLPEFLMTYLDEMVQSKACAGKQNVTVKLNGNPLECTCKTLQFLQWLLNSEVFIYLTDTDECRLNGGRYNLRNNKDLRQIIELLRTSECADKSTYHWVISVLSSLFACLLGIVLCSLVYRHRWKIRYLYYSRNRRYLHEGYNHLFENDAFVSYAKKNASFIKSDMVPSLEGKYNVRLWVADRNSIAGNSIAENITHAIYNSRKAVLLVDRDYLKDRWCDYEMNMALMESIETKRKMVIVVLFEAIPMEELPLSILQLLRKEKSLDYPQQRNNQDTFWMNLTKEIRSEV